MICWLVFMCSYPTRDCQLPTVKLPTKNLQQFYTFAQLFWKGYLHLPVSNGGFFIIGLIIKVLPIQNQVAQVLISNHFHLHEFLKNNK